MRNIISSPFDLTSFVDAAPEKGEDFQVISDDYQKYIVPGITHWQHPSFFAYYPTGSTFEGIIADLYASSVSNPGFNVRFLPFYSFID